MTVVPRTQALLWILYPVDTADGYSLNAEIALMQLAKEGRGGNMIRYGKCIRLTRREAERLQRITGFEPVGVKTLGDLDSYVRKCKAYYDDGTRDAAIINHLIDSEVSRCQLAA